jgi:hypothetical protein
VALLRLDVAPALGAPWSGLLCAHRLAGALHPAATRPASRAPPASPRGGLSTAPPLALTRGGVLLTTPGGAPVTRPGGALPLARGRLLTVPLIGTYENSLFFLFFPAGFLSRLVMVHYLSDLATPFFRVSYLPMLTSFGFVAFSIRYSPVTCTFPRPRLLHRPL